MKEVAIKDICKKDSSALKQKELLPEGKYLSSTIRKLEELQQKTIAECDALKQAMLREVFE